MTGSGRRRIFATLLLALSCASACADEASRPLSVYGIDPVRDGVITGATGLLALYPVVTGYHFVYTPSQVYSNQVIPFDRHVIGNDNAFAGHLSDATVAVAVAAPVGVAYFGVGWNRVLLEDLMVYAQTMTINSAVTGLFKYTTQRPMPLVYSGDPSSIGSPGAYLAFYSGHVSATFAALSYLSLTLDLRYGAGVWPWIVTGVVGTSVAAERVAAGQHFYTDVIAGAIMGTAVGVLVPWLHRRQAQKGSEVSLEPAPGGAAATWTHHF